MPENEKKYNIVMPMSGHGRRFQEAGFVVPKPYIDIFGTLMFQIAFGSVGFVGEKNIFIIQKDHLRFRNIDKFISKHITNGTTIVEDIPSGQAISVLKAKEQINNETPLFICNCDHKIFYDQNDFIHRIENTNADGAIISFYSDNPDPKYSYLKMNESGFVIETAEKQKISNFATAGIYYFSKGSDFVHYAEKMISENKSINGEYYVSPVYNEMILDNKKIINMVCNKITSFGTPAELTKYLWDQK